MSTQDYSLADVLELFHQVRQSQHFHCMPARVVSYDADKQTATVEPMTQVVSRNADDERIVDTLPILPEIPVEWPRGGGYFLTMPLDADDEGLLIFTDTDLGAWRDSGQVSDPGDERRHALGGCVFRPGLSSVARVLTGAATGHLVLGKDGGGPAIHIDGSTVQLGAAGGQFVALANLVLTELGKIKTAASTAVNGDAFRVNMAAVTFASVAATKAKAT